jgi:hypothetical protein
MPPQHASPFNKMWDTRSVGTSPFTKMWGVCSVGVSPFCFTRKHTFHQKLNARLQETTHTSETSIFSHIEHISQKYPMKVKFPHKGPYFQTLTQISNENQIFTQMAIFSHIEHISHKYSIQVTFSHNWPYFNTLTIFYTIIVLLSVAVLVFWNSWHFQGGHCTSMELHWTIVFLAWSSRWRKEESHQINQTLPHRRHSQLWRFIIFQV